MKRIIVIAFCLLFAVTGCKQAPKSNIDDPENGTFTQNGTSEAEIIAPDSKIELPSENDAFTSRDVDYDYSDRSVCTINYSDTYEVDGSGASFSGSTCTISRDGVYIISGKCDNTQILVSAPDSAKIQLVLSNADLASETGSVILIASANKVFITSEDDTENTISDAKTYKGTSENDEDAAIFSKADLTLNGGGTLTVNGNYAHGIVSKDDLIITSGTYNITSVKTGVDGKDRVKIKSGVLKIDAGTDAIRSSNTEDTEKGFIHIYDGEFEISSQNDGMQAETELLIGGGIFDITTATGCPNNISENEYDDTSSESSKALKASSLIGISGGTLKIDSADDAIHCESNVILCGGNINIRSGDDAIHAETVVSVIDTDISVDSCNEGIEGRQIYTHSGNIVINAKDDGINANSPDGMSTEAVSETSLIQINGGSIYLNTQSGDGLDSNGAIEVTDGIIIISGATNGPECTIDYNSYAKITGGVLIGCGTSEMSQNFGSKSTQVSVLCNMGSIDGGTRISCCDENGNIIVSFVPEKAFSSLLISSPTLKVGNTYSICINGTTASEAEHGFATDGMLENGESLGEITLDKTVMTFSTQGANTGKGHGGR